MTDSNKTTGVSKTGSDYSILFSKIKKYQQENENKELFVSDQLVSELKAASMHFTSWDLSSRQLCDLELLLNGGFAPLSGFLNRADYESVLSDMRLESGSLWPVPIMLDVTEEFASGLSKGEAVALRDLEGKMLAVLFIEDVWEPNKEAEAEAVYGTTNTEHPGTERLFNKTNTWYVGGRVAGLCKPTHYDFTTLRHTPAEMRKIFSEKKWNKVVAFQTRNPMHRAHFEITKRAAEQIDGKLLIHPIVGETKPGDIDPYTRVRCYNDLMKHYPQDAAFLSVLPLAMRLAGPREALWHAIIRKNYGCTHFIVGRDHAGPGSDSSGKPFYGPYAAQELLAQHEEEVGIKMVPFQMMVYVKDQDVYLPNSEVPEGAEVLKLSGTELRERLRTGKTIPEWFTFPEINHELRKAVPTRTRQGFTVFFSGLPSSGKSTVANALRVKLLEIGGRRITLLDGDIVRKNLSSELTFSKEHRDLNIRRIGFVASEITKNGGIAICAPIAPYDRVRKEVRENISSYGGFILVHVATPVEVCEKRDVKGLYAKARAGVIKEFTGISDPYEEPLDAERRITTTELTADEEAEMIVSYLKEEGYLHTPEADRDAAGELEVIRISEAGDYIGTAAPLPETEREDSKLTS